jgi:hypothetical protein
VESNYVMSLIAISTILFKGWRPLRNHLLASVYEVRKSLTPLIYARNQVL